MTEYIELHQPENSSSIQSRSSITTEQTIFTIRNKSTYASKTNFVDIIIQNLNATSEAASAANLSQVRLMKNVTMSGTESFSDINTTNSVVEIDTTDTATTGGVEIISLGLAGKDDAEHENLTPYRIIINPGETVSVRGSSDNSATIKASILWRELF